MVVAAVVAWRGTPSSRRRGSREGREGKEREGKGRERARDEESEGGEETQRPISPLEGFATPGVSAAPLQPVVGGLPALPNRRCLCHCGARLVTGFVEPGPQILGK